jgi:hypothetical protein
MKATQEKSTITLKDTDTNQAKVDTNLREMKE